MEAPLGSGPTREREAALPQATPPQRKSNQETRLAHKVQPGALKKRARTLMGASRPEAAAGTEESEEQELHVPLGERQ